MTPQEATTSQELLQTLVDSNDVLEFVPRQLLIDTLGEEHAKRFLPAVPEYVSVNVDNVLMVAELLNLLPISS